MKKSLVIIVLTILSAISLSAQNPIKWRSSIKMVSKTEGIVTMKAIIEPGWHLYGIDLPKGGPKATSFDFSSSVGIKLIGNVEPSAKPKVVHDKLFDLKLNWWEESLSFTQRFKLEGKGEAKVNATISYMGCNDETCLPPSTKTINIVVPKK